MAAWPAAGLAGVVSFAVSAGVLGAWAALCVLLMVGITRLERRAAGGAAG